MPAHHFRIRFRLPQTSHLAHDQSTFELDSPSGRDGCVLRASGGVAIEEAKWLIITDVGTGFPTEEEATIMGQRVKNAILWCAARMGLGVDLGDDKTHGGASRYLMDLARKDRGIRLLNEPHGLLVYEEDADLPTRFTSASGTLHVGKAISSFNENFSEALDLGFLLTEKETVAFELYGLSYFEASSRARFLTLVYAIESLCEPKPRSQEVREHIAGLMILTRDSGLPRSEVNSILSGLGWLKNESISKTGRDLVEQLLSEKPYDGKVAKEFFRHCYNVRSEIVHSGKPSDDTTDLRTLAGELNRLVADLLVARVESKGEGV